MTPLFDGVFQCLVGKISETEPGAFTAEFYFAEDFTGFAGHFPGNPVVPGIALIMAVQVTVGQAEAWPDGGPELFGVKRCKFSRPVRPGETVRVKAVLSAPEEGKRKATARLSVHEEACAEMTLFLGRPGPQKDFS